jgi:hypothetical protein
MLKYKGFIFKKQILYQYEEKQTIFISNCQFYQDVNRY